MISDGARILLADHQVLFRQSLSYQLSSGGHEVIGEAESTNALDRCLIEREPDIIMIDRYLPGMDALEYCRMLNGLHPQIQVLLLVAYEHEARELQSVAFLAGAAGCLSKDLPASAYLAAVRRMRESHLLFQPEVMRRAARPTKISGPAAHLQELTARELEILSLVAQGLGNREIADRLAISPNTAMKHVSNIFRKLKVGNRMEAGLIFIKNSENGLVPGK